jgi:hypothetical protein
MLSSLFLCTESGLQQCKIPTPEAQEPVMFPFHGSAFGKLPEKSTAMVRSARLVRYVAKPG